MQTFLQRTAFVASLVVLLATAAFSQTTAPAATVSIKDYAFKPPTVMIRVGQTIRFVNNDDDRHTVTDVDGMFDSKGLDEGKSFSYTFTKPGTFHYYCKIHTQMKGTIVVRGADAQ